MKLEKLVCREIDNYFMIVRELELHINVFVLASDVTKNFKVDSVKITPENFLGGHDFPSCFCPSLGELYRQVLCQPKSGQLFLGIDFYIYRELPESEQYLHHIGI